MSLIKYDLYQATVAHDEQFLCRQDYEEMCAVFAHYDNLAMQEEVNEQLLRNQ